MDAKVYFDTIIFYTMWKARDKSSYLIILKFRAFRRNYFGTATPSLKNTAPWFINDKFQTKVLYMKVKTTFSFKVESIMGLNGEVDRIGLSHRFAVW